MTEVVEPEICATRFSASPLPGDLQNIPSERHTGDSSEHEIVGARARKATHVVLDSLNEESRDGNRPPTRHRFRLLDKGFSPHRDGPTLLNAKRAVGEVNVFSSEPEQLGST
jgi:hypothetical protein